MSRHRENTAQVAVQAGSGHLARGEKRSRGEKIPHKFDRALKKALFFSSLLGIVPVVFKKEKGADAYINLNTGIRRWVEITYLQPLDIEDWLRKILTGPAEIAPNRSESDFVARCLQREDRARYFIKYARQWQWVEWLHEQKLFSTLLSTEYLAEEPEEETVLSACRARHLVADWLGERLASGNQGRGLWLVRQSGGKIGPVVAAGIAWRLTNDDSLDLSGPAHAAWITLICQSPGPPRRGEMLGRLLEKLAKKRAWPVALQVLAHVSAPNGVLEESFTWGSAEPKKTSARMTLQLTGGSTYLSRIWVNYFRPALTSLADELLVLFEAIVRDAQRTALSIADATDRNSPLVAARSRIQADSQYASETDLGIVLTWFCEVISQLAKSQSLPTEKVRQWLSGSNPVLYRLGLHALNELTTLSHIQKLEWILSLNLLYRQVRGARHEAYALLKSIHPNLEESERVILWRAIIDGPPVGWGEHLEATSRPDIRQNEIDRLVLFLHSTFPTEPAIQEPFENLKKRSPEFVNAKHEGLDMDFWFGEVRDGARSPKSVDDLLKFTAQEQIEYLLTYTTEDRMEATREGLVSKAAIAANQNPTWGMELLHELAARNAWESDIWTAVFWTMSFTKLPVGDQHWFLDNAGGTMSDSDSALNGLTHFLFNGGLFAKDSTLDAKVMEKLIALSVVLWQKARRLPMDKEDKLAETDWVSVAINRPAGRIVEFWLPLTETIRNREKEPIAEWPSFLAGSFDEVASAKTQADWQGLAIIGLQLAFARFVAPEWTRTKIYPLLDFNSAGDRAWPLWRSFVAHSRFNRDLLLELPRYYPSAAPFFAKADEKVSRDFLASVGLIIYPGLLGSDDSEWLRTVLLPFDENQRAGFASSLAHALHDLPATDMAAFWHRWMRAYWQERLLGRPFALSSIESNQMLSWLWLLPAREFAEAVPLAMAGSKPQVDTWAPMFEILESDLPREQPGPLLDVWAWMLDQVKGYYVDEDDYKKLLGMLPKEPSLLPKWERVCQVLSRLGASCAQSLLAAGKNHFQKQKA